METARGEQFRNMKKRIGLICAVLFIFSMVLAACGQGGETSAVGTMKEAFELDNHALSGEGAVTRFIGEPFYDGKIENDGDAYAAVISVIERLGGDESTELVLKAVQPTEDDITYYMFAQVADMVEVYGSSIKLIVNKDKEAIGLVSTIVPKLKINSGQDWEVTEAEAEEIVKQHIVDEAGMEVIPGITESAVVRANEESVIYVYSWVVYTNNNDLENHAPYIAHYVAADGEYLYSIPVSSPGNEEALSGSVAAFAFDSEQIEPGEWTGTVTKHDGTEEELTVPVMIDKTTGETILGDTERKILCADYADFKYKKTLSPLTSKDNSFTNNELLIYRAFIDVYDLYTETGWTGPDGQGTPCLLLMDMVEENGEVIHNACYSGLAQGFRTFCFNREDPDGECYDIIAHEFTHCLTETAMKNTIYENDCGAINESMSDILGNIIEAILGKTEDKTWLIQENGNEPLRCMSDPNQFSQPAFVWDRYYVPPAAVAGDFNDQGGVHINSSLLSAVGYAVNEAGMPLEDQMYYWMNVSFAMTPKTDYMLMADLLPWCMELFGYSDYLDALNKAIEKTGIKDLSVPEKSPDGTGLICMEFPESIDPAEAPCSVDFYEVTKDASPRRTWPDANNNIVLATLDEGDYIIVVTFYNENGEETNAAVANAEGWKILNTEEKNDFITKAAVEGVTTDFIATVNAGYVLEVETETLAAAVK